MIRAYGEVKLACSRMNRDLGALDDDRAAAIEAACLEMIEGKLDRWIVVSFLQGGAGTSLNMNVNEVLANRALQILSRMPERRTRSPPGPCQPHQSTNDTFPTALRIAAIRGLRDLERDVTALVEALQAKEREFARS